MEEGEPQENGPLRILETYDCGIFTDSIDCEKYLILDAGYITYCFYLLILFYLHVSPIEVYFLLFYLSFLVY